METAFRERYDKRRSFEGKSFRSLCYAPFSSLYFDIYGNARVCCHNWTHPAGNVLENTLDEIWSSARIKHLREDLKNYKYGHGCDFCYFQTADGNLENLAIDRFDYYDITSPVPAWPQQMEFALSNTCNLECVMCTGMFSSTIRSRREKLEPIPRIYSDEILESFRKYLPHLKLAKFLGGEPFLITEYQRIWDMMIEDELHIPCHVTTNGTQFNRRIERILEQVPMGFAVSLDGVSRQTVESIRVNAKYDEVMQNARRFRAYSRFMGTSFTLTFCLMRPNWHEFGDYCMMADEWDCPVYVNTVTYPPQLGIYTQPPEELRKVLDGMEAQIPRFEKALRRNRRIWFGELARIRAKCSASASKFVDRGAGGDALIGSPAVSSAENDHVGSGREKVDMTNAEDYEAIFRAEAERAQAVKSTNAATALESAEIDDNQIA
jgi:MoaA/NifB/PqqE/SkfB family radical SAM enzyme